MRHNGPMETAEGARYVLLTKMGDATSANIMAARLESEGIEVRVHSAAFGPYPVTLGQLAEAELWVLEDRVAEASTILLDSEVTDALHGRVPGGLSENLKVAAVVTAAVVLLVWLVRFLIVIDRIGDETSSLLNL